MTEADQASILMTFLSAFGVIVGRGPHFTVEGTEHHANLFCVLVGQSSKARKGTSLGRVLELLKQAPLKHLSGISTGEGLIQEVSDANDNKKTVIDKRRWIVESEFARCLMVMKREGNTLSSILRDAWDTGNMYVLTKNTPLTATNAHIGITSHITQKELVVAMGQTEMFNGFGNRFLWAFVKRSKCLPDDGSVDFSPLKKEIASVVANSLLKNSLAWPATISTLLESDSGSVSDGVGATGWGAAGGVVGGVGGVASRAAACVL